MSNLLIIGDIHNKVGLADLYLKRFPDTSVIFLGDYFDDFGDTEEDATHTAEWLKESLTHSNRIHLIGNHDYPYMVNGRVICPGWTKEKQHAVNKVLSPEDWAKFKFFHYEKNYYFSHAGITKYWFGKPLDGEIDPQRVEEVVLLAHSNAMAGLNADPLWAADQCRGGWHDVGGLLWCDWRVLEHLPGVNQIVGHTPSKRILMSSDKDSRHINVDCFLNEALLLSENGLPTVIKKFGN